MEDTIRTGDTGEGMRRAGENTSRSGLLGNPEKTQRKGQGYKTGLVTESEDKIMVQNTGESLQGPRGKGRGAGLDKTPRKTMKGWEEKSGNREGAETWRREYNQNVGH